jgi:hypothetical protein
MSAVPLVLCADASNALHIGTLIVEAGGRVPPRLAAGAEWRDVSTWPIVLKNSVEAAGEQ